MQNYVKLIPFVHPPTRCDQAFLKFSTLKQILNRIHVVNHQTPVTKENCFKERSLAFIVFHLWKWAAQTFVQCAMLPPLTILLLESKVAPSFHLGSFIVRNLQLHMPTLQFISKNLTYKRENIPETRQKVTQHMTETSESDRTLYWGKPHIPGESKWRQMLAWAAVCG